MLDRSRCPTTYFWTHTAPWRPCARLRPGSPGLAAPPLQIRVALVAAGDFGVAQGRWRCFVWGAAPGEQLPPFPKPTHNCLNFQVGGGRVLCKEGALRVPVGPDSGGGLPQASQHGTPHCPQPPPRPPTLPCGRSRCPVPSHVRATTNMLFAPHPPRPTTHMF